MADPKESRDDKATATIELPIVGEPKEETPLTVADISDGSFTKQEIEAAKKHGLVVEEAPPVKKPDEKKDDVAATPPAKTTPEVTPEAKSEGDEFILDAEKEQKFQELFGENQTMQKLYHRMKKNRTNRQNAEAERDQALIQKKALEEKTAQLQAELAAAKAKPANAEDDLNLDETIEPVADEGEKPLTRADLDRIEKEKAEQAQREAEQKRGRAADISDRLDEQSEEAKVRYKDFDTVMDLTADLMKNLPTLVPDRREQQKVATKIKNCIDALANADKYDPDQYNGADMAYEIGQLHPKYKAGGTDTIADKGADLTPDKLNRIVNNSQRRSSAALNGGAGRRVISVENLTVEDMAAMPTAEFRKLRKDRPDIVKRLLGE